MDRLDEGKQVKLTFLCAPAGFGKTTLLSEWTSCRKDSGYPVAWLTLDEGDQDPNRFWGYVIQALSRAAVPFRESTLSLLLAPYDLQVDTFLVPLINEIADFDQDFTLVLDDYHLIVSEAIHASLGYLLNHIPANMHLVIASRSEVPLPLARLRARGQLVEIRASDLRFSLDESRQFLGEVMHLSLSPNEMAQIDSRIEGWVVGLQMAGLSLQGRQDHSQVIGTLSEGNHFIFDFLAEEVLNHQPEDVQSFLLKTSILDELSGPLCAHLTGLETAPDILHQLEHANLFLAPINPKHTWYRYHHLFASYLQECLRQRLPEIIPDLHLKAAQWYADNNNINSAIAHALEAGALPFAVDLIDRIAEKTYELGQWTTLIRWIQQIPDSDLFQHPKLCSVYASILAPAGHLNEAERVLVEAEKSCPEIGGSSGPADVDVLTLRGEIVSAKATIDRMREDFPTAIKLSHQAIPLLPKYHYSWSNAILNTGHSLRLNGQMEEAAQMYNRAIEAAQENRIDLSVLISGTSYLAASRAIQGRLHLAAEIYRHALKIGERYNILMHPSLGIVKVGLAEIYREWDDNEEAARYLKDGLQMALQEWGDGVVRAGYVNLERILRVFGDLDGALDKLRDAQYLLPGPPHPRALARIKACQAWLAITQGNLENARRWAQSCKLDLERPPRYIEELEYSVLARVWIADGEASQAAALIAKLVDVARASDRQRNLIELLVLHASACAANEQEGAAAGSLLEAVSLAEPEGYLRSFADEGRYLHQLAGRLAQETTMLQQKGISQAYLGKLVEAMKNASYVQSNPYAKYPTGDAKAPRERDGHPVELVEPLQSREIEILRLLAAGLSNQEIADDLIIGVNTVRWYVKNIYAKLDVHSRTQAAARARQLNLL